MDINARLFSRNENRRGNTNPGGGTAGQRRSEALSGGSLASADSAYQSAGSTVVGAGGQLSDESNITTVTSTTAPSSASPTTRTAFSNVISELPIRGGDVFRSFGSGVTTFHSSRSAFTRPAQGGISNSPVTPLSHNATHPENVNRDTSYERYASPSTTTDDSMSQYAAGDERTPMDSLASGGDSFFSKIEGGGAKSSSAASLHGSGRVSASSSDKVGSSKRRHLFYRVKSAIRKRSSHQKRGRRGELNSLSAKDLGATAVIESGDDSDEDENVPKNSEIIVPIFEDTGSFYDTETGEYTRADLAAVRAFTGESKGRIVTGNAHSMPSPLRSGTGHINFKDADKHGKKKDMFGDRKRWRIGALWGIFVLVFLHEVVGVAISLGITTFNFRRLVDNFEDTSNDVIRNLSTNSTTILSESFNRVRTEVDLQILKNVSSYVSQVTFPAYGIRDQFISQLARSPLYDSFNQLDPSNFRDFTNAFLTNMRYTRQRYLNSTYMIGVGFDEDGTFWGMRYARDTADLFDPTARAAGAPESEWPVFRFYAGMPMFVESPGSVVDGTLYCNIPERWTTPYQTGTPDCRNQSWIYSLCPIDDEVNHCDLKYGILNETSFRTPGRDPFNAVARPWYRTVKASYSLGQQVGEPARRVEGHWSPLYVFASTRAPGVTYGVPIVAADKFLGVSMVDLYLNALSNFLTKQDYGSGGVVYIVERMKIAGPNSPTQTAESGILIATSNGSEVDMNGNLFEATKAEDALTRNASTALTAIYGGWKNVPTNGNIFITLKYASGVRYCDYVDVQTALDDDCVIIRFNQVILEQSAGLGLNWLLISAVYFSSIAAPLLQANEKAVEATDAIASYTKDQIAKELNIPIYILCGWVALSFVLAYLTSYGLSKPLRALSADMLHVARLDFNSDRPRIHSRIKEVYAMTQSYNKMREGLEMFAKFVPESVVRRIVRGDPKASQLYVTKRNVTVLFSDIKNFTAISETVELSKLIQLLAEYLACMVDIVESTRGTVGDFIGDGLMVFWNSPDAVVDHATAACECALRMHEALEVLNKKWSTRGYPLVFSRIGIHTGEALSGNIGSVSKMKFGVVGDTVNLASRLENLNKAYGTSRIISEGTVHELHEGDFVFRPLDRVAVKGKNKAVEIYELAGRKRDTLPETQQKVDMSSEAYDFYRSKQFAEAAAVLNRIITAYPEDSASRHLLLKVKRFLENPQSLPNDWDGTTVFHEK